MKFPRCSGILLHFTSLPARFGIGDLGPCAYEFADFLFAAGQKLWQVLPLNPTGYGDSPYQCFSAFAGNPLLLSLERLRARNSRIRSDSAACGLRRMKFVREQFFLAAAAQNIKRLVRFLSQVPRPPLAVTT